MENFLFDTTAIVYLLADVTGWLFSPVCRWPFFSSSSSFFLFRENQPLKSKHTCRLVMLACTCLSDGSRHSFRGVFLLVVHSFLHFFLFLSLSFFLSLFLSLFAEIAGRKKICPRSQSGETNLSAHPVTLSAWQ
jgi:hypothetical protein